MSSSVIDISGNQDPTTVRGIPDLSSVVAELGDLTAMPRDYLPGKSYLRDRVMSLLTCSAQRAEKIVDQLEKSGYVTHTDQPPTHPTWQIVRGVT